MRCPALMHICGFVFFFTVGNYSLHISPVELEDDGDYVCQMMAAEGVEPAQSRSAKLIVIGKTNWKVSSLLEFFYS